eukprot:Gb_24313 [translate_table: standard]
MHFLKYPAALPCPRERVQGVNEGACPNLLPVPSLSGARSKSRGGGRAAGGEEGQGRAREQEGRGGRGGWRRESRGRGQAVGGNDGQGGAREREGRAGKAERESEREGGRVNGVTLGKRYAPVANLPQAPRHFTGDLVFSSPPRASIFPPRAIDGLVALHGCYQACVASPSALNGWVASSHPNAPSPATVWLPSYRRGLTELCYPVRHHFGPCN